LLRWFGKFEKVVTKMDEQKLYEKQYTDGKLKSENTFPFLRKIFSKNDIDRVNMALNLLPTGERLLDVGCGSGSLLINAKQKFKNLYGVDLVRSRIESAKEVDGKQPEEGNPINYSFCNINQGIDFDDEFFDCITCIAVIEHLFDPFFIIKEINRVLKNGGVFISQVPNIGYIKHRLQLLFGILPVTSSPYNWEEIGWGRRAFALFYTKNLLPAAGKTRF